MMEHEKYQKGPRACSTCAKAKSRCIPGPTDGICERCHRLKKPCLSQTPAPQRQRKEPKPTRIAELEKRLEDLTQRIEAQVLSPTPTPTPSESVESSPHPAGTAASSGGPQDQPRLKRRKVVGSTLCDQDFSFAYLFPAERRPAQAPPSRHASLGEGGQVGLILDPPVQGVPQQQRTKARVLGIATPAGWMQKAATWDANDPPVPRQHEVSCVKDTTASLPWPQGKEAEQFLDEYREHMAPLFPFVMIPSDMSAERLQRERPFLWKAVMMQSCHLQGARQLVLASELLNEIVLSAFMKPKKSFDMLQALEVMVAWFHVNLHSCQMTNILFLLRSICISLGFHESADLMKQHGEFSSACLERLRAYTGVYHLVTMVFTTDRKPDALMNTTYLEDCCGILESQMEYPTDQLLVYIIRIQQLAQSIAIALSFRSPGFRIDLPVGIIVKSFQQQIEQFRASLPEAVRDHRMLTSQIHIAEMLLYEIGIHDAMAISLALTDRLELLWSCLNSVKSFLEIRFQTPVYDRPRFNCMASFDFVYAMITCLKLSTLTAPGWDLRIVRKELEFDKFVEKQLVDLRAIAARRQKYSDSYKAVTNAASLPVQEDPFSRLAGRLESLRDSLRIELDASLPPDNVEIDLPDASANANAATAMDVVADVSFADANMDITQYSDAAFWQDLYRMNGWQSIPIDAMEFDGVMGSL